MTRQRLWTIALVLAWTAVASVGCENPPPSSVCPCDGGLCCFGVCVAPDHPRNCGGCGVSCREDQVCSDAVCACAAPLVECAGECADLSSDAHHCGTCGAACPLGQVCAGGECACPESSTECRGECVDVLTDPRHCGACGAPCLDGTVCVDGSCGCESATESACPDVGCVDLRSSNANCGACGVVCSSAQTCVDGACACSAADETYCEDSGQCLALRTDHDHCGACDVACPGAQVCSSGTCACPVPTDVYCPSEARCTDLTTDRLSCGACGEACPDELTCIGGTCGCPTSGTTHCPAIASCVDLDNDRTNCGACGNACPAAQACVAGACACPTAGEMYCASVTRCVDTSSEDAHCGGCDMACPGTSSCATGACVCPGAGETLCSDGCHDFMRDATSCGGCGIACSAPLTCIGGACACPPPSPVGLPLWLTPGPYDEGDARWAHNDTRIAMVYMSMRTGYRNVEFLLLDAGGVPVGPPVELTHRTASGGGESTPAVAWSGSEWGVAWQASDSAGAYLMFQRLTAAGAPIGTPVAFDRRATGSTISMSDLVMTYSSTLGFVAIGGVPLYAAFFGSDGSATPPLVSLGGVRTEQRAIAAAPSGALGVGLVEGSNAFFVPISSTGVVGARVQLTDSSPYPRWLSWFVDIAYGPSGFVVATRQGSATNDERVIVCPATGCATTMSVIALETVASSAPVAERMIIEPMGTRAIVGWQWAVGLTVDMRMREMDLATLAPTGPEVRVYNSPFQLQHWDIAWIDPSNAIVAWSRSGAPTEIYDLPVHFTRCP